MAKLSAGSTRVASDAAKTRVLIAGVIDHNVNVDRKTT